MTTAYSTLMGLAEPVQGELSGTWGDTVNKGITEYLDVALAGTQTISGTQTAVTLSLTNGNASATNIAQAGSGATGSAQFAIINCTGAPASLLTITVPASSRQYIVINATSTSQSVKVVGVGPTTGVTIVSGEKAHIVWNGSDFVKVASTAPGAAAGSNTQVQYNSSGSLAGSANLTFDGTTLTTTGNAIISDNSANAALRITQTGAGNALLVEDSANPDSTPFVIDASGKVAIGATTATENLNIVSDGRNFLQMTRASTNTTESVFAIRKARGTNASPTIVSAGDNIGTHQFLGYDGTQYLVAAQIYSSIDGTPGTNDMPGNLVFSTTADGASSPTERMRIDNAGNVGIGGTPAAYVKQHLLGTYPTSSAITQVIRASGTIPSGSTTSATVFQSIPTTQAAAFTCGNLFHFGASQQTFGAGSTVTTQAGFVADSTLTGATNNFGFYSDIASGTGRYNFYANGTAANVFVGQTSLGGAQGSESLRATPVASAVNYVNIQGSTTGNRVVYRAQGSDTNVSAAYDTQGSGSHAFRTDVYGSIGTQFLVAHTASAVNYVQVTGGATGIGPVISAQGSDANAVLTLQSKGANQISLQSESTTAAFGVELAANTAADRAVYVDFHASSGTDYDYRLIRNGGGNSGVNYINAGSGSHAFITGTSTTQLVVAHATSAVNYMQVTGGDGSTTSPQITLQGSSTNITGQFYSKGAGNWQFLTGGGSSLLQFNIAHTASAVNYVQVTGGVAGGPANILATGSDSNVDFAYQVKGSGLHRFFTSGNNEEQFRIARAASAVNYAQVTGSATGGAPTLSALGSDTNIDLNLTPKGTGKVNVSTRIDYKVAGVTSEYAIGNAGASKTVTWSNGAAQSITLDQNTTLTFSFTSCPVGMYQLKITQDGTGGRTITWSTDTPGTTKWIGSAGAPALNSAASSVTFVNVYWDGTNAYGTMGRVNAV